MRKEEQKNRKKEEKRREENRAYVDTCREMGWDLERGLEFVGRGEV